MEIPTFDVAVANDGLDPDKAAEAGEPDGYTVHRVIVVGSDQMVAEQMSKRLGLRDAELNLAITYVMVYVSLKRRGVVVGDWPEVKPRLLSLEGVTPPATVDPTPSTPDTPSP